MGIRTRDRKINSTDQPFVAAGIAKALAVEYVCAGSYFDANDSRIAGKSDEQKNPKLLDGAFHDSEAYQQFAPNADQESSRDFRHCAFDAGGFFV